MKLLLDANLSHRLVDALIDLFPEIQHVRMLGLQKASDFEIWTYAAVNGFTIVSKDSDFRQRSFLLGNPPKVIWVAIGNSSTSQVETLLREQSDEIQRFQEDAQEALLVLG